LAPFKDYIFSRIANGQEIISITSISQLPSDLASCKNVKLENSSDPNGADETEETGESFDSASLIVRIRLRF
jgi:hypothetical protein